MEKSKAVRITDKPDEAQYYHDNNIPYIVWLNESNRGEHFPNGAFCVENKEDIDDRYIDRVYRRALGIAWDILSTKRLIIREITVEDVPRLYELYSDSEVTEYMEPLFDDINKEIEYTREYIKNIYGFYGYGLWVIVLKQTGKVIGRAGLECREGFDGLELGFMLGKEYQHKGYAYEACSAILKYGADELAQRSFTAKVHVKNESSRRLCERLGFEATGVITENGEKYIEYSNFL